MTKKQHREHKQGNQHRKLAILNSRDPLSGKRDKVRWLNGVIQNGKYTPK